MAVKISEMAPTTIDSSTASNCRIPVLIGGQNKTLTANQLLQIAALQTDDKISDIDYSAIQDEFTRKLNELKERIWNEADLKLREAYEDCLRRIEEAKRHLQDAWDKINSVDEDTGDAWQEIDALNGTIRQYAEWISKSDQSYTELERLMNAQEGVIRDWGRRVSDLELVNGELIGTVTEGLRELNLATAQIKDEISVVKGDLVNTATNVLDAANGYALTQVISLKEHELSTCYLLIDATNNRIENVVDVQTEMGNKVSTIGQTADSAYMMVQNGLTSAAIIAAINDNGNSQITIDADQINITGVVDKLKAHSAEFGGGEGLSESEVKSIVNSMLSGMDIDIPDLSGEDILNKIKDALGGKTLIYNGYINTSLIKADAIITDELISNAINAANIKVKDIDTRTDNKNGIWIHDRNIEVYGDNPEHCNILITVDGHTVDSSLNEPCIAYYDNGGHLLYWLGAAGEIIKAGAQNFRNAVYSNSNYKLTSTATNLTANQIINLYNNNSGTLYKYKSSETQDASGTWSVNFPTYTGRYTTDQNFEKSATEINTNSLTATVSDYNAYLDITTTGIYREYYNKYYKISGYKVKCATFSEGVENVLGYLYLYPNVTSEKSGGGININTTEWYIGYKGDNNTWGTATEKSVLDPLTGNRIYESETFRYFHTSSGSSINIKTATLFED